MKSKIFGLFLLFFSVSSFSWWSMWFFSDSTHYKMTTNSRGLLTADYPDVKTKFGGDISNWTSGPDDDKAAHGEDSSLNGGPVARWQDNALELYKSGNLSSAYYYTALLTHLVEDQAVPAHASEISHGSWGWMDNMEQLAYWNYNYLPAPTEIIYGAKPTDSYYAMKFYTLDALQNNPWTTNYWIPGIAGIENTGAYAGLNGTDVFPTTWGGAGENERGLMLQLLTAGIGHAAGGLISASKMLPPSGANPPQIIRAHNQQ
ncbi:MAG: hypothetical protein KKH28_11220 [Elusimicrobia bacterium]|nr:hypothetical protein [Elusimicrobiota bacterium]